MNPKWGWEHLEVMPVTSFSVTLCTIMVQAKTLELFLTLYQNFYKIYFVPEKIWAYEKSKYM